MKKEYLVSVVITKGQVGVLLLQGGSILYRKQRGVERPGEYALIAYKVLASVLRGVRYDIKKGGHIVIEVTRSEIERGLLTGVVHTKDTKLQDALDKALWALSLLPVTYTVVKREQKSMVGYNLIDSKGLGVESVIHNITEISDL